MLLFAVAAVTDYLDGVAARRFHQESAIGGLFDHATDCTFVTLTLAGLAMAGQAPWLLVALIPLAFLQYTLDSGALAGRQLRTNRIGKSNGIGYFILPGAIIVQEGLGLAWIPAWLLDAFAWALVATTVVSMTERLLHLFRVRKLCDNNPE